MRSPRSSSRSNSASSSSSRSLAATILNKRLLTIFKKAQELTTLCDVEACVIHYGPDGELKTWPEERDKVRSLALRYIQLDKAKRRKKSVDLSGFLHEQKKTTMTTNFEKKAKRNVQELKYPISDHYTPDQISQMIQSLELSYSTLQERLRFLEARKQAKANLEDHQEHLQTQSLNPSRFTKYPEDYSALPQESGLKNQELCVYDRNNNFQHLRVNTQGYSALRAVQESGLQNQLMQKELYGGYDQNMCLSNININNFQPPCVSNTQDFSALPSELQASMHNYGLNQLMQMGDINVNNFTHPCVSNTQDYSVFSSALQESVNNYGLNQLMQHELYGFDQNMCLNYITNSNILDPCLSNRVSGDFCFNFQDPYGGNMVGNPSLSQDFPDMSLAPQKTSSKQIT